MSRRAWAWSLTFSAAISAVATVAFLTILGAVT